jgi:3-hydroxybutyryl-CoA dehydrogenase
MAGATAAAARAGHEVYLFDMDAASALAAPGLIRREASAGRSWQRDQQPEQDAACARLHPVHLEELADAALVIEAIVELAEPKQAPVPALEAVLSESAILAPTPHRFQLPYWRVAWFILSGSWACTSSTPPPR